MREFLPHGKCELLDHRRFETPIEALMDATLRRHYGRFIDADLADAFGLSKIDSGGTKWCSLPLRCPSEGQRVEQIL